MPIWSRKWPFLDYTISAAPNDHGVFGLWRRGELILVGAASTRSLRQCLLEHWRGIHGDEQREADHYSWEVSDTAEERKREVLAQFKRENGRLPRLNRPNQSQDE